MRPLSTAVLALALAGLACGSSSTDANPSNQGDAAAPPVDGALPDAAASADAARVNDASPGGDAQDAADAAASAYPAFRPKVQTIQSAGGPVIVAPVVVPIVFANTTYTTQIADYIPKAVVSAEWAAALAEYGVGAGTSVALVTAAPLPSNPITKADLETYVQNQIGSGAWGAPDTAQFGSSLYVLFLEPGATISLPNGKSTCNGGPAGFHHEVVVGATDTPYAIVADCGGGQDRVTRTAWHEIAEACTDPYAMPNRAYFAVDTAWAVAFVGGENGDMCEHRADSNVVPADIGYNIQRTWSNASALAYHDPCVVIPTTPYFAATPVLPDTVTIGQGTSPGVTIAVGASKTIEVQLWSDGPTPGPFTVSAKEPKGGTTLGFAWDATSGQNGDVLHLTITALTAAPGGTTFIITSSLGAASSEWVGGVGN